MLESIPKFSSLRALAILLLVVALLVVFSSYSTPPAKPGECVPDSYCREWINGSCTANMQYMERECYRVAKNCLRETYYERKQLEANCP